MKLIMRVLFPLALLALVLSLCACGGKKPQASKQVQTPPPAPVSDIGVVLLHGKGGTPGDKTIAPLADTLKRSGYLVSMPLMPWSPTRSLDIPYDKALDQISGEVAALKRQGVRRVIVAGYCMGANAALAYTAEKGKIDGIKGLIVLAPAHTPDLPDWQAADKESLDKANAMIAAGHGNARDAFMDRNQDAVLTVTTTAVNYLSYFDPNGLGNMSKTASRIPQNIPFLFVVGTADPIFKYGPSYIFGHAPDNPNNSYETIIAGHQDTPEEAKGIVLHWLKNLPE